MLKFILVCICRARIAAFLAATIFTAVAAFSGSARAQAEQTAPLAAAGTLPLIDLQTGGQRIKPSSGQVTAAAVRDQGAAGLLVTIRPGQDAYPGIAIQPNGPAWDLSRFGHIEARLVNTGTKAINVSLRVDNAGDWKDSPWNAESVRLQPGESGTVTTIFGYSYGHKPGFALKPNAVVNLLLFAGADAADARSFRVESIVAGGPPGERPPVSADEKRVVPSNGFLFNAALNSEAAAVARGNAGATVDTTSAAGDQKALRAVFPPGTGQTAADGPTVAIRPTVGRWDLRDFLEVQVGVRNDGAGPLTPRVRLDSNGGSSDWTVGATLRPGAAEEITVPFAGATPADPAHKETGSHITSDAVAAVVVGLQDTAASTSAGGERALRIESIKAGLPPVQTPSWLGKRPPVAGDWVKTLDDEFNGSTLETSIWNVVGENYYDKTTHWSKNEVILGGGVLRLRYEKKTGFQNDDPERNQTAYAAGYLDTYGKWAQRYGYFEARMKLPAAPGLWPAFWMMPDRGVAAGPEQGKRQDTANGGMEFDIMEHLTRWGGHRYNIAMHYDGYAANHKSVGSDKIYVQTDKDGFLTCGLLWTPGLAVYYCNGTEVLRWENPRISNVPAMLMFTLPSGGWDNNAVQDDRLPSDLVIDYVRVWQRRDMAPPTDGKQAATSKPTP